MNALVELGPSNGISTPPFWPPISIQQISFPHGPGTLRTGKVRRRVCRPHMSESSNLRMRGSPCPEAWALPMLRGASTRKSEQSHTRASFPPQGRPVGSVEAPLGTPATLVREALRGQLARNPSPKGHLNHPSCGAASLHQDVYTDPGWSR